MKGKKATKRALLSSALSLVLCFSMLLGTTFAWFTDTASTAVNTIVSGTLDVDLIDVETGKSLDGKTLSFKNFEGNNDKGTNEGYWEPNCTYYTQGFKVANLGNLWLKYQLAIGGITGDLMLLDVVDFYLTTDVSSVEAAKAKRVDIDTFVEKLAPKGVTETVDGVLYDDADTYYLVGHMDKNAENEYQNKTLNNIAVTVYATQVEAEFDSFGKDYDADALPTVNNAAELATALENGMSVKLGTDMTLTEGIEIPKGVAATLDLNGKTLTGTMHKADGSVVKNNGELNIIGGTISSTANNGGSAVVNNGTLTVKNATLNGAPNADGSWPSYTVNNTGTMTISDSKITSVHGAVSSYGAGAVATLNDTDIDMTGIPGFTSHGIYTYNDGKAIVNGGNIANNAADQNASGGSVINGNVEVNGGTFTGRIENYSGTPVLKGGTFTVEPKAAFVAEGYKAVDNGDGTWTVKFPQNSLDELIKNAQSDTVEIPAGTYTFPASKLEAGMTLDCAEGTVFEGKSSLDIKGATVVGATFSNPSDAAVAGTINGTFKDCVFEGKNGLRWCNAGDTVVFENCVFSGSTYGVHFDGGAKEVIFKNCTFSGFNALGGAITKVTMEGCTFKANGKSGYNGINLWGSTEMKDCTFVFDGTAGTEWVHARGTEETYTIKNCVVTDGKVEKPIQNTFEDNGTNNTVTIDGVPMVSSNDALKAAVANGDTKVLLAEGEYDLNGVQKDGLTLIGIGNNVKVANTTQYASGKAVGAIWQAVNLENVTITNTVYTMADGGNATFTNVNFAKGVREAYGSGVVFTNCTFGSNSEGYALHFQSASSSAGGVIKLTGCDFEGGKVHLGGKRTYEFTGCAFASGTDFQAWSGVTLTDCTVGGEKVTAGNVATLFPKLDTTTYEVTIK